jgi:hypothetical protein
MQIVSFFVRIEIEEGHELKLVWIRIGMQAGKAIRIPPIGFC